MAELLIANFGRVQRIERFVALGGSTSIVAAGYDLFQTQPGTEFLGAPLEGVPLGTYNFGGTIGVQNVGDTDTIIQRLNSATDPSAPLALGGTAANVSLQMDALDLVTAAPTTFNGSAPLGIYYITLDPNAASLGTMVITFLPGDAGGTFSSTLDVNFDIHAGSLTGTVVGMQSLTLSSTDTPWVHTPPPPGAVVINGVNNMLDGSDTNQDFWPGLVTESHPGGMGVHVAADATTPLPATFWGGSALMCAIAGLKFRRNLVA